MLLQCLSEAQMSKSHKEEERKLSLKWKDVRSLVLDVNLTISSHLQSTKTKPAVSV